MASTTVLTSIIVWLVRIPRPAQSTAGAGSRNEDKEIPPPPCMKMLMVRRERRGVGGGSIVFGLTEKAASIVHGGGAARRSMKDDYELCASPRRSGAKVSR